MNMADAKKSVTWERSHSLAIAPNRSISDPTISDVEPMVRCLTRGSDAIICQRPHLAARPSLQDGDLHMQQHLNRWLEQAVRDRDDEDVLHFLRMRADPAARLGAFRFPEPSGKMFLSGSLVHIAVMRGRADIMRVLVEHSADMQATYGFEAGVLKVQWEASAIFAAVPSGNLTMVGEMLELKADIESKTSLNATPLLEAIYFGHLGLVKFLIGQSADLAVRSYSQDHKGISYSAVQLAARKGAVETCRELVRAKADFEARNETDRMYAALDYAIELGHSDIVRLLVSNSADLLKRVSFDLLEKPMSEKPDRHSSADLLLTSEQTKGHRMSRSLDLLFSTQNPILFAAAAEGLSCAPKKVREMLTSDDCLRFFEMPGDSAPWILKSIFFDTPAIKYWRLDNVGAAQNQNRIEATSAYFPTPLLFPNASAGPSMLELRKLFDAQQPATDVQDVFLRQLVPQDPKSRADVMVSVQMSQCLLSNIHKDIRWLLAIRRNRNEALYDVPGCQALITYLDRRFNMSLRINFVIHFTSICFLAGLTFRLRQTWEMGPVQVWALPIFLLSICEASLEILQAIGYKVLNIFGEYFYDLGNWNDFLRLIMTGGLSLACLLEGDRFQEYIVFRVLMSSLVMMRWMKALSDLRAFPRFGVTLLPIVYSILDVGNFCAVLLLYIFGFGHAYAALAVPGHDLTTAFMIAYRLGMLADFELDELEGKDGGCQAEDDEGLGDYYHIMRVLSVIVTFLIAITVMNVFIAVLSNFYTRYAANWKRLILQIQTDNAIDGIVLHEGFHFMQSLLTCRCLKQTGGHRRLVPSGEEFLWICSPKSADHELDEEPEFDLAGAIQQIRSEVGVEIGRVYHQVNKLDEKLDQQIRSEEARDQRIDLLAQRLESISKQLSGLCSQRSSVKEPKDLEFSFMQAGNMPKQQKKVRRRKPVGNQATVKPSEVAPETLITTFSD